MKNSYIYASCQDPGAHFFKCSTDGRKDKSCAYGPHDRYIVCPGACPLCDSNTKEVVSKRFSIISPPIVPEYLPISTSQQTKSSQNSMCDSSFQRKNSARSTSSRESAGEAQNPVSSSLRSPVELSAATAALNLNVPSQEQSPLANPSPATTRQISETRISIPEPPWRKVGYEGENPALQPFTATFSINHGASPPLKSSRRRRYNKEEKRQVAETRSRGACEECRASRTKVNQQSYLLS